MTNSGKNTHSQSMHLQATLLENALDFLLSAAESVGRDEGPRSLKEAILHLANGIELLIKARLATEHWSLIFADIDKASHSALMTGDFISVEFPKAVERLGQIVGVTIEQPSDSYLRNLRKLRNRLTHFHASLDLAQANSLIAKSMSFCIEFCRQHDMTDRDAQDKLADIHRNLVYFQEFVDERVTRILSEWNHVLIWTCPSCWQETLIIDGGEAQCKFCSYMPDCHALAVENTDRNIETCPECGDSTFALTTQHNNDKWVCFSCGEHDGDYGRCFRCDGMVLVLDPDEPVWCNSCLSDILDKE